MIKVKLLFSAFVFTIISYIITNYNNLADEGVRCSMPGSILQNTSACADTKITPLQGALER